MYIFLDESGDLGFDFDVLGRAIKAPSDYFGITLLVCYDSEAVKSFQAAVKHTMRRKINHKRSRNTINELKGTHTLLSVKKYFLNNLLKKSAQNWCLHAIVLDKRQTKNEYGHISHPDRLYNALSKVVLESVNFKNNLSSKAINLIVDKCKGKHERGIFDSYLKTHLETKLPQDVPFYITHGLSHDNAGLQAVDLFCHGFVRKYSHGDTKWYNLFKNKIVSEVLTCKV